MTLAGRLRNAPWSLPILAVALTAIGISTVATAAEGHRIDYAWLQARWAVVSLAAALLVVAVPYRRIVAAWPVLLGLGVAALVLVLVKGTGQSAGRWIELGSFRMQPSEFVKPILVIAFAGTLRYSTTHRRLAGLVRPLLLMLIPFALVMRQPDLGTALLFVPVLFAVLFAAGARLRHLVTIGVAGLVAAAVFALVPGILKEYQRDRLFAFLARHTDARAASTLEQSQNHQIHQGLMAIGQGGITGVSDDEGGAVEAARAVPERHSDFAFAVFSAKHGLLGVTALLLLYAAFLGSLLSVAARVREPSGRFLVVGLFAVFAVQILVNLGMTVGLLPVVGVPLPFVSYGGSSLLACYLGLGLAVAVGSDPPIELGRTSIDDD
jgi:rod shape determining protein RodA